MSELVEESFDFFMRQCSLLFEVSVHVRDRLHLARTNLTLWHNRACKCCVLLSLSLEDVQIEFSNQLIRVLVIHKEASDFWFPSFALNLIDIQPKQLLVDFHSLLDYMLKWEVLCDLRLVNLVAIFLVQLGQVIFEIVSTQLIGLIAGYATLEVSHALDFLLCLLLETFDDAI